MVLGASIDCNSYHSVLDIGTGTGVLALMAKQKNHSAKVTAIDIDEQSLVDCKTNFKNSPWATDLSCFQQDFMTFSSVVKFDCIICNPPYYENGLLSETEANNRAKHAVANFSLETLFINVKNNLKSNGHFWLILPYTNADKWVEFGNSIGLFTNRKLILFGKPDSPKRVILTLELHPKKCIENVLLIRNDNNTYTDEYKTLTKDFHNREL